MDKWNLIIYAPAYNIEKTAEEFISRIDAAVNAPSGLDDSREIRLSKLFIIDDGSSDDTKDILEKTISRRELPGEVIKNKKNLGAADAVMAGMKMAAKHLRMGRLDRKKTIIIRMDSDLEHQPEDIPRLIERIISGKGRTCVGWIPFEPKNGIFVKIFNEWIGKKESKEFLGVSIPQFFPGFVAVRGDLFLDILGEIGKAADEFESRFKEKMIAIDFVTLVISKKHGEEIIPVKLRKIEDKHIKKQPISKITKYLRCHERTVSFLRSAYKSMK